MCARLSHGQARINFIVLRFSLRDPIPTLGTAWVSIVVRVIELWGCRFKPGVWGCRFKPAESSIEAVAGRL